MSEDKDKKIKELQNQLENAFREKAESKENYDRLYKDYVTIKGNLQDEKRLNERYLSIIENLTKGE